MLCFVFARAGATVLQHRGVTDGMQGRPVLRSLGPSGGILAASGQLMLQAPRYHRVLRRPSSGAQAVFGNNSASRLACGPLESKPRARRLHMLAQERPLRQRCLVEDRRSSHRLHRSCSEDDDAVRRPLRGLHCRATGFLAGSLAHRPRKYCVVLDVMEPER